MNGNRKYKAEGSYRRLRIATNAAKKIDPAYRAAMGWNEATPDEAVKAALTRAHDIRKFEIELYWKRANYFWLLQGAVFAGFGFSLSVEKEASGLRDLLTVSAAYLGLLCAFAGWLSAKGSKFWQSNWEKHIDSLEDAFEGKIHKTVWIGSDGIRHSVSRLNSDLLFVFALFWLGYVTMFTVDALEARNASCCTLYRDQIDGVASLLVMLPVIVVVLMLRLYSRWTRFVVEPGNKTAMIETEKISIPAKIAFAGKSLLPWPMVPDRWRRQAWLQRSEVTGTSKQ